MYLMWMTFQNLKVLMGLSAEYLLGILAQMKKDQDPDLSSSAPVFQVGIPQIIPSRLSNSERSSTSDTSLGASAEDIKL